MYSPTCLCLQSKVPQCPDPCQRSCFQNSGFAYHTRQAEYVQAYSTVGAFFFFLVVHFGMYNYQECLHSVYKSVKSNKDNILGSKRVKYVAMETDHHGQGDWK